MLSQLLTQLVKEYEAPQEGGVCSSSHSGGWGGSSLQVPVFLCVLQSILTCRTQLPPPGANQGLAQWLGADLSPSCGSHSVTVAL